MSLVFSNWFWVVGDVNPTTQVWSTSANAYIANNSAAFLTWLADSVAGALSQKGAYGVAVISAADNGSGKTRLLVDATTFLQTGQFYNFGVNGNLQITVIDATHIDLTALAIGSYITTTAMYGASVIDTAAHLSVLIGSVATLNYRQSAVAISSSTDVTLTNTAPTVVNVTLTGTAAKVILPPANTPTSLRQGDPIVVNNVANDRTIGVYAADGTTLIAMIDRGGSTSVSLRDNSTANGAWVVNLDVNRLTQNFTGVGDTNYSILNTDKVVGSTAAITTIRTWQLPPAAQVNPAQPITVGDYFGGVNANVIPFKYIILAVTGSDTINGQANQIIRQPFQSFICWSDGVSKWTAESSSARPPAAVGQVPGVRVPNHPASVTSVDLLGDYFLLQDTHGNAYFIALGGLTSVGNIDSAVFGVGGRDQAGAFAANTTIYLYVIGDGATGFTGIWSVNPPSVGPNVITGYNFYAFVAATRTDGSGNLPTIAISEDYRIGGYHTIASASTLDLNTPTIGHFEVTGVATISAILLRAGKIRTTRFQSALTINHILGTLELPTSASITTAPGDFASFQSVDGSLIRMLSYFRADGTSLIRSTFTFAASPPSSPLPGDQWFNSTTGALSISINDGNSTQWVQISPPPIGMTGPAGPVGPEALPGLIPPPFNPLPLELDGDL